MLAKGQQGAVLGAGDKDSKECVGLTLGSREPVKVSEQGSGIQGGWQVSQPGRQHKTIIYWKQCWATEGPCHVAPEVVR